MIENVDKYYLVIHSFGVRWQPYKKGKEAWEGLKRKYGRVTGDGKRWRGNKCRDQIRRVPSRVNFRGEVTLMRGYHLEDYGSSLTAYSIIHSRICPLDWLIWLRNWLSHLHSHKYPCIFIHDIFDKKILSHIFFKVSLKLKQKTKNFEP